ncbi:MAG TPA: ThuA domain-containing protein [Candidatus Acidoferrum sp.]|nr:ThuA domain-containing protein [Candidatus Acidoferrum sp.]
MSNFAKRRDFLRTTAAAGASMALAPKLFGASQKSVLVFTKSSGFEHDVVKRIDGKLSIVENTVTELGKKNDFSVVCSKDGRIFDSSDFAGFGAMVFFTTGDLTVDGTDKNPPMTAEGKQKLLDAIHEGKGFVGVHAASDTFHTKPDTKDLSSRYVAYGEKSDPYLRMIGGEFIVHGSTPRLQTAKLVLNDPKFPGLEGAASPVEFTEEWYSLKDFMPDLHVIATLDTAGMKGNCYERKPYPVTWARMHGKGRVFYTAMGDRPENWQIPFFLNLLGGGIRFALGTANGDVANNLTSAAPGYAEIPPKEPPTK